MRVLLVEPELGVVVDVTRLLESNGAVVSHVDSGEEALELLRCNEYNIVVLELMLPRIDGYEVVRRMRFTQDATPILVLSGLASMESKLAAFHMGADDYITKPFYTAELLARIHANVRRHKGISQPALKVGSLELNPDSRTVTADGKRVTLTPQEYEVLELLVLRKGTILTKEAFRHHLYGGVVEGAETDIINVLICTLRRQLRQAGADKLICTVFRQGYVMREPDQATMPGLH